MRYVRVPDQQLPTDQPSITNSSLTEDYAAHGQSDPFFGHIGEEELMNMNESNQRNANFSSNSTTLRVSKVFPLFTIAIVLLTGIVYAESQNASCSQPLMEWSFIYVTRHVAKTILYYIASRQLRATESVSSALLCSMTVLDMAGSAIWALGGYYIFHTDSCSSGVFSYAVILWSLQSISLLLPCCFLSVILFCAPCLLWLAPYIIRPNPNTIATNQEVLSKIPKIQFSTLSAPASYSSCSICLGEYTDTDEVMKLPCSHFFHSPCITEWACVSQLCPICRTNITSETATGPVDAV